MKRIAWLSPFSTKSSIGEFSHTIIESVIASANLSRNYKIDIITNESSSENSYITSADSYSSDLFTSQDGIRYLKNNYDAFIYNFGNNVENHLNIMNISMEIPGIIILHDYVYHHLFADIIFNKLGQRNLYQLMIGRDHGEVGLRLLKDCQVLSNNEQRFAIWDSNFVSKYPLLGSLIHNTHHYGLVTHSEMVFDSVKKSFNGPVLKLRLPGDEKEPLSAENRDKWKRRIANPDNRISFAIIGHIQRSKKIHHFIDVLINHPNVIDMIENVIIAGKPSDQEYVTEIEDKVSSAGLSSYVKFEFDVTHDRLQKIKDIADVFVNIREPNTEGGSGSLIEQMACGKPVIVFDSGVFSEVTKGLIKIKNKACLNEISEAIASLYYNRETLLNLGIEAQVFSNELLSVDYAQEILKFAIKSRKPQPNTVLGINILDELRYDQNAFNPEPLVNWSTGALKIYLELQLAAFYENDFFDWILEIRSSNPIQAYEIFCFAKTFIDVAEKFSNNITCERWRLPNKFGSDEIIALSNVRNHYFLDFLRITSSSIDNLAKRITFRSRNSKIFLINLLGLAKWPFFPDTMETSQSSSEMSIEVYDRIHKSLQSLLNFIEKASDEEFIDETINKAVVFFDCEFYRQSNIDLVDNFVFSDEDLLLHFRTHGIDEKRIFRWDFDKIINVTSTN